MSSLRGRGLGGCKVPIGVSYMGTKRALAGEIGDLVGKSARGPFLDLFAGMCSIGSAVGNSRRVWSNDCQHFAWAVAQAFFCSVDLPPDRLTVAVLCRKLFDANLDKLRCRFGELIDQEKVVLAGERLRDLKEIEEHFSELALSSASRSERTRLKSAPRTFPRRLFVLTYPGSYLSLSQCAAIDSLIYAVETLHAQETITDDVRRWLLLAACKAMSRVSTSTGHFAQPLNPNANNKSRYFRQRRRSVWAEFLSAIDEFVPMGSRYWRRENKAFRCDALTLLKQFRVSKARPRVIYADPPYTNDHYSRYYHLFETLLLYDYPEPTGVGRYRHNRFASDFSTKTKVHASISALIEGSAEIGADLVLSYPTNGLLVGSRDLIPKMLKQFYRRRSQPLEISHSHSAMGGSKGHAAYGVTEVIYHASMR
jgi:adenine-specific DNA-methyltransferase